MRIAVVLALLIACGRFGFEEPTPDAALPPVVAAPVEYQSGTRLRAEVHDVGGTKVFVTWFDTLLGEECLRRVTEDGVMRCIPTRISVGAQYTDAACTTHLLQSTQPTDQTDCPSSLELASQEVGDRYRVVKVGAKYLGTIFQSTDGTCEQVGASSSSDFFEIGATLPADMFVAFHEERTPSGAFEYIEYVADDGARELEQHELYVTATAERCQLEQLAWNRMACVAKSARGFLAYADAGCTQPAFVTRDEYQPFGLTFSSTTCDDDVHQVALGDALPAYYAHVNGTQPCSEQNLGQFHAYRATALDASPILALAALTPRDTPGDVIGSDWIFPAGQNLPAGFYDRRHDDQCVVTNTLNERVCAPIWTGYTPVYGDTSCTMALDGPPKCRGNWRSIWYPVVGGLGLEWRCEGIAESIRLYDQPIAPPYYRNDANTCSLGDPTEVAPLGMNAAELPASEMRLVTRHMD